MHVIPNFGERDPANRSNARKSTVENLQTCRTNEIAANGIAILPFHLRVPAINRQLSFIAIAKTAFRKECVIMGGSLIFAPNACIRLPRRHAVGEGWGEVVLREQGDEVQSLSGSSAITLSTHNQVPTLAPRRVAPTLDFSLWTLRASCCLPASVVPDRAGS
jgi:hypothetical protein